MWRIIGNEKAPSPRGGEFPLRRVPVAVNPQGVWISCSGRVHEALGPSRCRLSATSGWACKGLSAVGMVQMLPEAPSQPLRAYPAQLHCVVEAVMTS